MDKNKEIVLQGTEVQIPNKVFLSDNGMGLVFSKDVTEEELLIVGKTLKTVEGAVQFWIGDWINANWGKYEHGKYDEAEKLGYDKELLRQYSFVSERIESVIRITVLSWSHHREVASLSSDQQKHWLQQAVENNWTVRELKDAIKKAQKPEVLELPEGKYQILYIDPPWQYSDKLIKGYGAVEHHYPTLSIEQIRDYKDENGRLIKDLADKNAVLFLWVPIPILLNDLSRIEDLIQSWKFRSVQTFIWDKQRHNYGHYVSATCELLLICIKGSYLPKCEKLENQLQSIKRSSKHSKKPEEFRQIINKMYSSGKRIELFARKKTNGWDTWGDEIK